MLNVVVNMVDLVQRRLAVVLEEETGQGLAEYALILGLIAILAFGALTLLGVNITSILSSVAGKV